MIAAPHPPLTVRLRWSEEDGEYLATVDQFPSLSWLDPSPQEAVTRLVDVALDEAADIPRAGR